MSQHILAISLLVILAGLLFGFSLLVVKIIRPPKPYQYVRESLPTPYPIGETFYISDNMGGFDGYLIDHKRGEKLPPGRYRVRDLGSAHFRWKDFDYPPTE